MILLFVAVALLAGTALGALGFAAWWPAIAMGGAGVALGIAVTGDGRRALLLAVVIGAGVASLWRYEAALPPSEPGGVAVFNDGDAVHLLGTVDSEPEERETSQRFVVDVTGVEVGGEWKKTSGRILVTQRLFPPYRYGDVAELTAMLETPPVFETFDYREYLARQGIVSTAAFPSMSVLSHGGGNDLKRLVIDARRPFGQALGRTLPEPEAALAQGILLGQRASIPDSVNEAFNAAGISHLIAISGYNVMLVAGAVIGALTPFAGRPRATFLAMGVVVAYAVFVGGSPSVLRAMLMAQVMLGATLVGRPGSALTGVTLAGALLVLWRPLIIEDVSFQLSFAATLGIVLMATPLRDRLVSALATLLPVGPASFLAEQVAVTTAATVAVLPIIASSFGRLSVVSLAANLLAAPIFAYALLGSFVTAVVGAVDTGAGRLVGQIGYLPLHYLVVVARVASSVPMASVAIDGFGVMQSVAAYLAIAVLALMVTRRRPDVAELAAGMHLRPVPVAAVASIAVAGFVWWGALQPVQHDLRVSILDIGQGDSILIETPSGAHVLVDGGPSGDRLMQALGDAMRPSDRRIDLMVLTHAQDDHVTGLIEALRRYDVVAVMWNGVPGESAASRAWEDEVSRQAVPVAIAQAGQVIDLGEGARIEVVHPQPTLLYGTEDDLNNNAVVLRVVYGDVSFLLTADIESEAEDAILQAGENVSATVLKVAHHGSDGSTTQPFLDAVSPTVAAISVGADNTYGHPSPTLRLRLAGIPMLRTDLNGTVSFETDGTRLWLDYERGGISFVDSAEAAGAR